MIVVSIAFLLLVHLFPVSVWAQDKAQSATPRPGGVYRRPLANTPSTLDPAISDVYGFTVTQQIFDGLVQYDGGLTITPALAQSWKASRNGLHWTFFLRKDVRFHNGRGLVASDVVYSFTRILDPRLKSKAAEYFLKIKGAKEFQDGRAQTVQGIRATDMYTVEIELEEASAPFVANLAIGYAKIIPREAVEETGANLGVHPVGTGPFRFVHWRKDEEIALEANPSYFGGRPFLDRVVYKIFPGHRADDMFAEFQSGSLEDTVIPAAQWQLAQTTKQYRFVQRPMLGVRFLGLNVTHPPLDNRAVRQALSYAIDRETLVRQIVQNRFAAGRGFLPPGTYGSDPQYRPYPYDPQKAKALLISAGYPGGKGLPTLQIWSSVKTEGIEREHEAIRRYLADVGIRAEFQYNTNWPAFSSQLQEGKLPIFRYGWSADVPEPESFLYRLFHSQGRTNLTHYHSTRVDQLLDRARAEQDYLKRVLLYKEIERLIMDDAPVIPLNYVTYDRLFQSYVQSIEVSALGEPYIPMRKIWLAK
jgi:oligopeptide transport system substrate-binding protein